MTLAYNNYIVIGYKIPYTEKLENVFEDYKDTLTTDNVKSKNGISAIIDKNGYIVIGKVVYKTNENENFNHVININETNIDDSVIVKLTQLLLNNFVDITIHKLSAYVFTHYH